MSGFVATSKGGRALGDASVFTRNLGYALLVSLFLLGFFHRFSPAILADVFAHDLGVSAKALGSIISMNFWIYTLMQLPAGLLIDRYGVRRVTAVGAVLTACGVFVLSMAESAGVALVGPALIGLGTSSVFSGIMKYNMQWFSAGRYALITGLTMLLGVLGSLLAEGPTAAMLEWIDWRVLLKVVAGITAFLSVLVFVLVRECPKDPDHFNARTIKSASAGWKTLRALLAAVLANMQVWRLVMCTAGTNGTFYAFAGLWAVPYLTSQAGMDRATAVGVISASMAAYGTGSLIIGQISDRMAVRKPLIVACAAVGAGAWSALAFISATPNWLAAALVILAGLSASMVTVSFTSIKESVGINAGATAVALANTGVFLVAALVQLLYGTLLDDQSVTSGSLTSTLGANPHANAMWLPALVACGGAIAASMVRESYPRSRP